MSYVAVLFFCVIKDKATLLSVIKFVALLNLLFQFITLCHLLQGYSFTDLFFNQASIEEALALDRESLLGRPVFVSRCVDKKENPTKFKVTVFQKLDLCMLQFNSNSHLSESDPFEHYFDQQ